MFKMNKVIRDGNVAVIYSPGYGAGWYSWNTEYPDILYDPRVVEWIENGKNFNEEDDLVNYLQQTYPDGYFSLDDLSIRWLSLGTMFRVDEYDGSESIAIKDRGNWLIA
jgi:hypothetical protein